MSARVITDRIHRLKDAVEGECEGLAITDAQAVAILAHVDEEDGPAHATGAAMREVQAAEAIVSNLVLTFKANGLRTMPYVADAEAWLAALSSPAPEGEAAQPTRDQLREEIRQEVIAEMGGEFRRSALALVHHELGKAKGEAAQGVDRGQDSPIPGMSTHLSQSLFFADAIKDARNRRKLR